MQVDLYNGHKTSVVLLLLLSMTTKNFENLLAFGSVLRFGIVTGTFSLTGQ